MKNLLTRIFTNIKFRQAIATFLKGILAGFCIVLCTALYVVVSTYSNKFWGGMVFPMGMLLILNFGYFLYTGKVCYLFDHLKRTANLHYWLQVFIGLIGNLVGTVALGLVLSYIFDKVPAFQGENGVVTTIVGYANELVDFKLERGLPMAFVLGVVCNILIYFATEGFAKIENVIIKHVVVYATISAFVLLGLEHCVATTFYLAFARVCSLDAVLFVIMVTLGNAVGGNIIPLTVKLIKRLERR